MNARTPLLVALLALPFSVQAGDSIKQFAEYTGMSERKVQMVIGPRTAFPEYRASYQRSVTQFRAAVGEHNFRRAMNGESFVLERRSEAGEQQRIAVDAAPAAQPADPVRKERLTGS
jgi:hypothetical protein